MGGGFVLVVGPSGAGKDTLIRLVRARLSDDRRFVFPQRLVTRPPSEHEDNVELSEHDFYEGLDRGAFALGWRAHGLGYAIPIETKAVAETGRLVICNVSRRVVEQARQVLPGMSVVMVTASPETLRRRLAGRGRAEDGDLGTRIGRVVPLHADCTIWNDADRDDAARCLLMHLLSRFR